MCPVCISTAAVIAYGTGGAAGLAALTALVLRKRPAQQPAQAPNPVPQSKEK